MTPDGLFDQDQRKRELNMAVTESRYAGPWLRSVSCLAWDLLETLGWVVVILLWYLPLPGTYYLIAGAIILPIALGVNVYRFRRGEPTSRQRRRLVLLSVLLLLDLGLLFGQLFV